MSSSDLPHGNRQKPTTAALAACLLLGAIIATIAIGQRETLSTKVYGAAIPESAIISGQGTQAIQIGMSAKDLRSVLGEPDSPILDARSGKTETTKFEKGGEFTYYKMRGIHCATQGDIVIRFDFVYRVGTYASYDGATEKGIGMWSTVGDVRRAYGKPEQEEQRYVNSGHRYTMTYPSLGVAFGFSAGELDYIRIERPTPKR